MTKPLALIIEDDPQLSRIFAKALESHFETQIAEDGAAAYASLSLARLAPRIIVLDLNLPGMSGKDILLNLRQDFRLLHTPVILCTADHHTAEFLQDKADIVLLKPVSPIQLREIAIRLI
jgi:DNA-binding response OmpR family regulator